MTDLIQEPLNTIAKLIRARKLSPIEVVEAYLRQIEKCNDKLNAVVTIAPDVLDRARAAEASLMRGNYTGALFGMPLTVKDTIETSGIRSTSGSASRADYIPIRDAPAVARLKSAGALILGKTNAAEMAMDYTADNPVFGRTNNPYDVRLCPGGSSGGEAAAIAVAMSAGGIGSDLAGSIRIPAHFCGIAGLKPGTGLVPGGGQFPPSSGPYSLGAVIGPMARTVEDLRTVYRALTANPSTALPPSVRGMRLAWYADDGVSTVAKESAAVVKQAATAFSQSGLLVEERRPPNVEHGHTLWLQLFSRASVVQLREVYGMTPQNAGSFVNWRLATADDSATPTLDEYISGWMLRDKLREELLDWMQRVPFILTPVGATHAYEHDTLKVNVDSNPTSVFRAFSYAQTFNVFDLPAVVVPAGHSSDGMPIGVQIAGRPGEEEALLSAAALIEKALDGWRMPALGV